MKNLGLLFFSLVFLCNYAYSQQGNENQTRSFFETLETPDEKTDASVRVFQDKRIETLVHAKRQTEGNQLTVSGFRVQVFSSNVQRTAKGEAFKIERTIKEEFPETGVYVNYTSPFWKVRVGDFKTQAQADAFRRQLIEALPQVRSQTYIVREQVLVSGLK